MNTNSIRCYIFILFKVTKKKKQQKNKQTKQKKKQTKKTKKQQTNKQSVQYEIKSLQTLQFKFTLDIFFANNERLTYVRMICLKDPLTTGISARDRLKIIQPPILGICGLNSVAISHPMLYILIHFNS